VTGKIPAAAAAGASNTSTAAVAATSGGSASATAAAAVATSTSTLPSVSSLTLYKIGQQPGEVWGERTDNCSGPRLSAGAQIFYKIGIKIQISERGCPDSKLSSNIKIL